MSNEYEGKRNPGSFNINTEEYKIKINKDITAFDPFHLLEQLYLIKNDETLNREEKYARVQDIMKGVRGD
ncbi:MAG: hypothetical protein CVU88_06930 [Firmicutes bacterium HGW-Firmicutes-13]|nr:MAG: hypothetical protein CVU88_06930 [Firmicutes bacterium HGW-Firmicutes-13]